ncbi:PucR family transcriptional regulator [Clostridium sp. AM58-1XD]|uniref:PucR family transcriptional regulator n=1 Tax=Clostridium sp. AM58-1XD TaxID=2292307 RepID=UPI000E4A3849|nr:PucR family transcriptional regulator [Clostridium sp. AM58-1XD]RGY95852.1 PucR family transcriptional regulator [Clostridium sp. AM58-1XD]
MLTVRELISLPELNNISCVVAENWLDTEISGCSVMEFSESIRWVKRKELVLTSGRVFETDELLQRRLIVELKECGCAALGVKVRGFLKDIPRAMIEEAKNQQLPILVIPFYYAFSKIGEIVYHRSFLQSLTEIQQGEVLVESLGTMFFRHLGLDAMLKKLSIDTGYTLMVTDIKYNIISLHTSAEYSHIFAKGTDTVLEPVWNSNFFTGAERKEGQVYRYINFKIDGKPYRFFVQALPDYSGCLCIPVEQGELDKGLHRLIDKSATILALELARGEHVHRGASSDYFLDFLREDSEKGEMEIVRLCSIYGFPYQYKRVCIVFKIDQVESDYSREKIKDDFQKILFKEWGRNIRTYLCAGIGVMAAFLMFKDEVSTFHAEQMAQKSAMSFVEEKKIDNIFISAGISRCHKRVSGIRQAFRECMEALNLRQLEGGTNTVFQYQDAVVYHMLCRLSRDELNSIYQDKVKVLGDYDRKNDTKLTETLKIYYDSHFNITAAAEKLYIHRNTMRQRLEKISELLNAEPDLSDCGYSLYLGLCVWRLLVQNQENDGDNGYLRFTDGEETGGRER